MLELLNEMWWKFSREGDFDVANLNPSAFPLPLPDLIKGLLCQVVVSARRIAGACPPSWVW
jgi:hypothetical protein